ncbi:hypothetical protein AB1Y20_019703 [Prymnesium parvum]|uniref:B30.2/SPRY domain-containing protein n=1 Tax=Prymnesium parvum TaxID=97485 RepID=A0AB34JRU4_PRYPA|eukprot:CAMPEP_0182826670 /NCGR_PEP_ID=MMETSP0006_2-20121128/16500_1 /TAXON_ID=97485 /ORGANISM="Prymnesium parvum, Strain Texoma1" /LENGTH=206 /DNA_ID=CAMNT_0024953855 /DNA_START=29 /DNA_END=649 /DNA_ORIENTATION=-
MAEEVTAQAEFPWAKLGTDWKQVKGTGKVIASGMLAEERCAVSSIHVAHGVRYFMFNINTSALPDGHMFLGVAAFNGGSTDFQAPCKTWAFNPPTGNLYIGEKIDEHGSEQMKKHFFADKDESLLDRMPGSTCLAKVDMDAKTLEFSINGNEFIDAGVTLPDEGVRPFCFLYHENDSITLTEVDASGFGSGGVSRPSTAGTDSGIA